MEDPHDYPGQQNSNVPTPQESARQLVTENDNHHKSSVRQMKLFHAAFVVLACSVSPSSVGLLGYCVARAGILGYIVVTFLSYFINFFTFELIMRTHFILKAESYDQIGSQLFGKKIKILIFTISTICLLGVSIGSLVYLKNVTVGLILSFSDQVPSFLLNTTFWAVLLCEGLMLPLSCMPRMKGISYISLFSSVLPVLFLILAVPHYFLNAQKTSKLEFFQYNPNYYLQSFSILIYPIMVQPNFLTIFRELINPTRKRMLRSLQIAFFSELLIYSGIAYFSYLHFSNSLDILTREQNVFQISSYIEWIPMRVLTLLFLVSPITISISMNITLKVQAIDLMCKRSNKPCLWNILTSFILCQIIMIPSVFLDNLAVAIRLVSAVFYPVICYVLPGLFYFKAEKDTSCAKKSMRVTGLIISGIFIAFSFYGAVDVGTKVFT